MNADSTRADDILEVDEVTDENEVSVTYDDRFVSISRLIISWEQRFQATRANTRKVGTTPIGEAAH